ncbi:helix-turn-helix domain-containing protein [Pseudomonas aeruginosa]|uniref:helix-turn-helix domain-containing protein n=1 Tax=Pseudomonas aeruginosa TaxID=287 RepID=UPI00215C4F99|nr:helix-turn-helix domain-containing protein [Pseudomonas aeruginosa]
MSPAQKAVLISLADQANDQGVCWPAVDSIATRCCLSKRAVQQAIKWLRGAGIVSVEERQGRSTMYSVTPQHMHPRRKCTPAAYAPPQQMHPPRRCCTPTPQDLHPTPADAAPRTVIEPTREPSGEPSPLPTRSGAGGWRSATGGLPECVGSVPGSLRGALECSAGAKRQGQFPGEATGGRPRQRGSSGGGILRRPG